jgi:hypothetical protein
MPLTSALLVTLALATGSERVLLCRPIIEGDPGLARAEALTEAVRPLPDLFLDYGVPCESMAEAARAAGRAGLGHGVFSSAAGRAAGARFVLVLTTSEEAEVSRRSLEVAPGDEAAGPLRAALRELEGAVPRPPPRWPTVAGWTLVGVGAAAIAAGTMLALQARGDAHRAAVATTPDGYQVARADWQRDRSRSIAALAGGGAAVALGLTVKFAF